MCPRVRTSKRIGGTRVHLYQAVSDGTEEWVVVALPEGGVGLASAAFDREREVTDEAFADGFEPLYAGSVPVWGY